MQSTVSDIVSVIGRHTVPTLAEERELFARMHAVPRGEDGLPGSADARAARDQLILRNIPLAIKMARAHARGRREADVDDLIGGAIVGLTMGVDRFDPSRGVRLVTFAAFRIRAAIQHATEDLRIIHVPRYLCPDQGGRDDGDGEYATRARNAARVTHMGGVDDDDGRSVVLANLADGRRDDEEWEEAEAEAVARDRSARDVASLLSTLDSRSAEVVRDRWGLGGRPRRTLKAIGEDMGMTRERIRQIERNALRSFVGLPPLKKGKSLIIPLDKK